MITEKAKKLKNIIRDGGGSALYAVYTVDTVDIVDTVEAVDIVDTVKTIQTALHYFKTSGMYAYIYYEEWLELYWNGLMHF